ncbi:MAG TPA: hypothetical protein VMF29_04315 [Candidatus Edwardsbacteria bacterium]|nr:hypothetical protein [Candidatus Edwardsbacteria bacterium]
MTLVLSIAVLGQQAFAAKYAGEFMYLGLGGRALGMGGAYASLADDGFACYWNPAGTAAGVHQAAFMHSSTFGGLVSYDAAGYARPLANGGCGLALFRLSVKDIPYTNGALIDLNGNGMMDPGERLDYDKITLNSDNEWFFLANYSKRLPRNVSAGINLKAVYKTVGPSAAWGLGLDAGALADLLWHFRAGLAIMDLTTTYLAWNTGRREVVTPTARLGLSWQPAIRGSSPLVLAGAADLRFEGRQASAQFHVGPASADLHLGAEFWIRRRLALRMGVDQGRFAAGAGLRLSRFTFDYAFLGSIDLGNSTRISASYSF